MTFDELMELQRSLQIEKMGGDPSTFTGEQAIQFFKDMTLALTDELHEALQEMGWKPWATSKHFNYAAVQAELIDALHFLLNLMLVAGFEPEQVEKMYLAKQIKNAKRQDEGYDGTSTKCPQCKRALDDEAVTCTVRTEVATISTSGSNTPVATFSDITGGVCERYGAWFVR